MWLAKDVIHEKQEILNIFWHLVQSGKTVELKVVIDRRCWTSCYILMCILQPDYIQEIAFHRSEVHFR